MAEACAAVAERVRTWIRACDAAPGELPADCELVHARRVRVVGRGALPDRHGDAFVKVMAFPRAKDRLRYAVRALPAVREARALRRLAQLAPDVPCPEVLATFCRRRFGLPALSVLVTRGLPVADRSPTGAQIAQVIARLAAVGLFHPDLNPGNFLSLADGRTAVLDLQSVRWRRRPLGRRERVEMAAKLLADQEIDPSDALVSARFLDAEGVADARRRAAIVAAHARRARLLRCLCDSTEFAVRRTGRGLRVDRRAAAGRPAIAIRGGRELVDLWLADRALELWADRKPTLQGLFRKSWWSPGAHCVYIPAAGGPAAWSRVRAELAEGLPLMRAVLSGRPSGDSPRGAG